MVRVDGNLQRHGRSFARMGQTLNDGRRPRGLKEINTWSMMRKGAAHLTTSSFGLFSVLVSLVIFTSQHYLQSASKNVPTTTNLISQSSDSVKHFSKHQLFQCNSKDAISLKRMSDRASNMSKIDSLFNCDLPTALCKYYHPANYFDEKCGLGKEFGYFLKDAEEMKRNGTLWLHMPSVGFPTLTLDSTCIDMNKHTLDASSTTPAKLNTVLKNIGQQNSKDGQHCLTERISLLPVHKAGCSSLRKVFDFLEESNAQRIRHKFFANKHGQTNAAQRETDEAFALGSLAKATKYPDKEFAPEQHVLFAIVRDPTERFISSIGQALGATGSKSNLIGPILKKECLKETASKTLKCLAHYVKDHGFWIELHFTPQVIDISFTTLWQDVPISVFPFKDLTTVMEYLGKGDIWERHGSAENYRSNSLLSNMSVDDYDEETLQIVCEIYEIDVRMQRSLGFQVPRCDPFIPHFYQFEQ